MTDKQVIKYCEGLCAVCDKFGIYNEEPCIYKIANELEEKLLCKEQECNKLYIQLKVDEEYHKEEKNTLRKIIKNKEERNIELYKENNKLKAENDNLKNELHSKVEFIQEQRNIIDEYSKEIRTYKKCQGNRASKREEKLNQTLTEIKEYCTNIKQDHYWGMRIIRFADKILQKINEAIK